MWLEFLDNTTHCLPEDKTLLCEGHRHVGLWVSGVDEYSRLGNCREQSTNKYSTVQKHVVILPAVKVHLSLDTAAMINAEYELLTKNYL